MKPKGYKYKVDNKMRYMGDTDIDKKVIRVNKKMHKMKEKGRTTMGRKLKRGELLDTIVHETLHAKHPKAHERTIQKMTKKKIPKMGKLAKSKLYGFIAK